MITKSTKYRDKYREYETQTTYKTRSSYARVDITCGHKVSNQLGLLKRRMVWYRNTLLLYL